MLLPYLQPEPRARSAFVARHAHVPGSARLQPLLRAVLSSPQPAHPLRFVTARLKRAATIDGGQSVRVKARRGGKSERETV